MENILIIVLLSLLIIVSFVYLKIFVEIIKINKAQEKEILEKFLGLQKELEEKFLAFNRDVYEDYKNSVVKENVVQEEKTEIDDEILKNGNEIKTIDTIEKEENYEEII